MKFQSVTFEAMASEQHFSKSVFITLFGVVLTFEYVDDILCISSDKSQ